MMDKISEAKLFIETIVGTKKNKFLNCSRFRYEWI